jgi:hypothetical protein
MELREQLELAALAAGIEYECVSHTGYPKDDQHQVRNKQGSLIDWNPHDDDGDSRRLEVVLCMDVIQHSKLKDGRQEVAVFHGNLLELEPHGNDPLAATRMAVLRCAAEIGLAMREAIARAEGGAA